MKTKALRIVKSRSVLAVLLVIGVIGSFCTWKIIQLSLAGHNRTGTATGHNGHDQTGETRSSSVSSKAGTVPKDRSVVGEMDAFLHSLQSEDLEAIDAMTEKFFSDTRCSRKEKIGVLTHYLFADVSRMSISRKYACDCLGYLKAAEITPELVAAYRSSPDSDLKTELIGILQQIGEGNPPPGGTTAEQTQAIAENLAMMQQFLTEIVDHSENPDQAYRAVYAFSALAKPEESATLIENAAEKWLSRKSAEGNGPDLPPKDMLETVFDVAMITPNNQNQLSPLLGQMLDAIPQDQRGNIDDLLLARLRGQTLTEAFKKEMRGYIEAMQPTPNSDSRYFDWLVAKEAVAEVPPPGGPGSTVIAAIVDETNPVKVASVVAFADKEVLEKMSVEDAQRYKTMLWTEANYGGKPEEAQLASAAMERLGEVLASTTLRSKSPISIIQ